MTERRLRDPEAPAKPLRSKRKADRTINDLDRPENLFQFRIDWKKYFRDFCQAHGGNPVEVGGRLLFKDGWSYSSTDYKGPEGPPPINDGELRELLIAYWKARAAVMEPEVKALRQAVKNLQEQTLQLSLPFSRKLTEWDKTTETTKVWHEDGLTLLGNIRSRLEWMERDLVFGREQIEDLRACKIKALDIVERRLP